MEYRRILLLLCLLLLPAGQISSQDNPYCISQPSGVDICAVVAEVQQIMAQNLPQKINSDFTIESVMAIGPILAYHVVLPYDTEGLNAYLEYVEMSETEFEAISFDQVKRRVCSLSNLSALIIFGASVRYTYSASDSYNFATVEITECP